MRPMDPAFAFFRPEKGGGKKKPRPYLLDKKIEIWYAWEKLSKWIKRGLIFLRTIIYSVAKYG
jgi:hypothetical protein